MEPNYKHHFRNQKGFTLVELMLVLALIGIAMAAAYQFLFFTQTSYARADARSAVIQEVDLFFLQLEKDIRSASEPNSSSKSINITDSGMRINIYCKKDVPSDDDPDVTVSKYFLTSYRLNETEIQRGFVSSENQSSSLNPQYGGIPDTGEGAWETVVSNILPGSAAIFSDSRNDSVSSRRLIDVDIYATHPDLDNSVHMQTALMSRTGKSTASIIASNASSAYEPVTSIKFFDSAGNEITEYTVPSAGKSDLQISARVYPTNATNKNLLWKQRMDSLLWLKFPYYDLIYDDGTGELIEELDLNPDLYRDRGTTRSGQNAIINTLEYKRYNPLRLFYGNPRNGVIEVVSPDNVTASLTLKQSCH
ncbi:MAG: prepilin-type N-terminal cleavage/methylation domain-containing protein [Syntrophomonadaceae bacterium]|nr:prepilin-type N-terminal cleavage/methylation domain-containing protein [Syntrophomonadaceae bacterium]